MANSILSNNPTQLLTKAKVNVSDWVEYTPASYGGIGTPSSVHLEWRRDGEDLLIRGRLTTGTVTASLMTIALPSGLVIGTNNNLVEAVGVWHPNFVSTTTSAFTVLGIEGESVLKFARMDGGAGALGVNNGNALINSSTLFSLNVRVPIQGWSSEAEFLAPLVQPKTAFIKDVKPNGTNGGSFTSGVWETRDLTTVEGQGDFLSLSSNQITLQSGEYLIEAEAPAYFVDTHKIKMYDITNSQDLIIGSNAFVNDAGGEAVTSSFLKGAITLTSTTIIELQHRCSTTRAAVDGKGRASGLGVDEVYTQVKITKLL